MLHSKANSEYFSLYMHISKELRIIFGVKFISCQLKGFTLDIWVNANEILSAISSEKGCLYMVPS